jgi:hypothetical protein
MGFTYKGWIPSFGAGLAVMLLSVIAADAATILWTNPAGGTWSNPANWSSGTVPGAFDDAVVALDGIYTVTLDTNVTVNSVTVGGETGTQTMTWAASNLLVGASFNIGNNAVFNLGFGTALNLAGVINNQGVINWGTTNALYALGDCTISNSGVFNLGTNFNTLGFTNSINYGGYLGAFINSGTVQVAPNAGTIAFVPYLMFFTNTGILCVGTNSILSLRALDPYTPMTFLDGTLIAGLGQVHNQSSLVIANGNITVNGTFELDGAGELQGNQTWSGSGIFNWYGGVIGKQVNGNEPLWPTNTTTFGTNFQVNVTGAQLDHQVIANLGTMNWIRGGIQNVEETPVVFNNYGLFTLQSSCPLHPGHYSVFNNYGMIKVPSSNASGYIVEQTTYYPQVSWAFTNYGTFDIETNANLELDVFNTNGVTLADGTIIEGGGTLITGLPSSPGEKSYLNVNGTITVNGPYNPYGTVQLNPISYLSGTQTWTGTGSIALYDCTICQPGTTTFDTNFNVVENSAGFYLDGHVVNNFGTFTATGFSVADLGHPATFNNYGTMVINKYGDLFLGGDLGSYYTNFGSSFNNYGTISISVNSLINSPWIFTNYGTINVQSNCILYLSGYNMALNNGTAFTGSGQTLIDTLRFLDAGPVTVNGNIIVNGALTLGSAIVLQGTQTWSGNGSLTWSGGSLTQPGTTTIAPGLVFNIADDPNDDWGLNYSRYLTQNHVLNTQGTTIWNSTYPVQMSARSLLENSGLVLLETNCTLLESTTNCAFDNQSGGTVRVLGGASSFNCPFNNSGTLDLEAGSLTISSNLFTLNPSSRCQFALGGSGVLTIPALNPNGVLRVTLTNGYQVTNGTTFNLIDYSSHTGAFNQLQLPKLSPGLKWQVDYGATALTLRAVPAPAQLGAPKVLSNGAFQFTINGLPGNQYQIQVSTNLVDWVTVQTNNSFSGQATFTDVLATNFSKRFYRIVFLDVTPASYPAFFNGQAALGSGVYYLAFANGTPFGYYNLDDFGFPWFYHYDMGFEYFIDANDGEDGAYLYDQTSGSFWYTSPTLFPDVYDFTLKAWLYYFPDTTKTGHYTTNPRFFYNFATSQIIQR